MQVIKCEMCGSQDFIKEDGLFRCQHCGAKYTVDEAKKMMVEGTVKVDTSDKLQNFRQLARRAKDSNDYVNAEKYYNMIVAEDPNDWEASFYSIYFSCFDIKNGEIHATAIRMRDCLTGIGKLIFSYEAEKRDLAFNEISDSVVKISVILDAASTKYHNDIPSMVQSKDIFDYIDRSAVIGEIILTWGDIAYNNSESNSDIRAKAIDLYKKGIALLEQHSQFLFKMPVEKINLRSQKECIMKIEAASAKIREAEPSFQTKREEAMKKGGCYVATCVYGSYDCPEVWTLRRYRDETLGATWYGRAFVRIYYAISPTLVKWFGDTNWFKKMWRGKLDRMVKRLNNQGFEDTPYQDKNW